MEKPRELKRKWAACTQSLRTCWVEKREPIFSPLHLLAWEKRRGPSDTWPGISKGSRVDRDPKVSASPTGSVKKKGREEGKKPPDPLNGVMRNATTYPFLTPE